MLDKPQLVLSLFPGIGLLDRAFEEEGFTVVRGPDVLWGGDIRNFHPPAGKFDGVIGGPPCQCFSALANLVRANGHEPRFGNLIPEFERCVNEAEPDWFLMENVPAAPEPKCGKYAVSSFLLNNAWLGEEQRRERRFSFGVRGAKAPILMRWIEQAPLELPRAANGVTQAPVNNSQVAKGRVQVPTLVAGDRTQHQRDAMTAHQGAERCQRDAVTSTHSGKKRPKGGKLTRYRLPEACRLQGLPENFLEDAPFTAQAKLKAVANGVPLPMGRALARAVMEAIR